MADYCKQCSNDWGFPNGLSGLTQKGEGYPIVICEGCGVIQVDNEGICVSSDCERKHALPLDKDTKYTDKFFNRNQE
ncbi:MAG: hypothetical protein HN802_05070 [Candidatus Jacksonbacteria bacterium]|jgi:hypothetical protein|nr:hypothetical protein [Candidatus Jacksonbacteria bacterium]